MGLASLFFFAPSPNDDANYDDEDYFQPGWRWLFARLCLQAHRAAFSSVFSTAVDHFDQDYDEVNSNFSNEKNVYSFSYVQLILTLKMLKSDPAQNAIANNLDGDQL